MRRYSEVVKADVRKRMSPPHRQSVAQISAELGIHIVTLYNWRKTWRLQGEVVPASEKDPEGWGATDKFTVVLETAGLNATELSAYCRERGLYPEQGAGDHAIAALAERIPIHAPSIRQRPACNPINRVYWAATTGDAEASLRGTHASQGLIQACNRANP